MRENSMKKLDLVLHRRPSKMVSIRVPKDTLEQLKLIAAQIERNLKKAIQ